MGDGGSEGLSARGDDFGGEHLEKGNPPGSSSPGEIRKAVEQCLLSSSRTLDVSGRNIEHLTDEMYRQPRIKVSNLFRAVLSTARGRGGSLLCQRLEKTQILGCELSSLFVF